MLKKSLLHSGATVIEKYEISKIGGGGINVWLSLDELERLKKEIDIVYEATQDLRNK